LFVKDCFSFSCWCTITFFSHWRIAHFLLVDAEILHWQSTILAWLTTTHMLSMLLSIFFIYIHQLSSCRMITMIIRMDIIGIHDLKYYASFQGVPKENCGLDFFNLFANIIENVMTYFNYVHFLVQYQNIWALTFYIPS